MESIRERRMNTMNCLESAGEDLQSLQQLRGFQTF